MTVLASVRANLVTAIQAQVPSVQVSAVPPAENTKLEEAIWVESCSSEFEWRSLGGLGNPTMAAKNRNERIVAELRVHVYREAPDHTDAADAALDRAEVLLAEIEDALEADFSLANAVTHALVTRWSVTPVPRGKGWSVDGRATVEAENYP